MLNIAALLALFCRNCFLFVMIMITIWQHLLFRLRYNKVCIWLIWELCLLSNSWKVVNYANITNLASKQLLLDFLVLLLKSKKIKIQSSYFRLFIDIIFSTDINLTPWWNDCHNCTSLFNRGGALQAPCRFASYFRLAVLREKCPYLDFFMVCIFPHSDWIRNKKTPHTGTFHAVQGFKFSRILAKRLGWS